MHTISLSLAIIGANEKAGQSGQKSVKIGSWYFSPPGVATGNVPTSARRFSDFARATMTRDIFIPGSTRPRLSRNRQTHSIVQLCRARLKSVSSHPKAAC